MRTPKLFTILKALTFTTSLGVAFLLGCYVATRPPIGRQKLYEKEIGDERFAVTFDFQGTLSVKGANKGGEQAAHRWELRIEDWVGSREFVDLTSTPDGAYELKRSNGTVLRFTRPELPDPYDKGAGGPLK